MARVSIDDKFISQLLLKLESDSPSEVTAEALTLLNWAVGEAKKGRVILSADEKTGGNLQRLEMPALMRVRDAA